MLQKVAVEKVLRDITDNCWNFQELSGNEEEYVHGDFCLSAKWQKEFRLKVHLSHVTEIQVHC